MFAKAQRIHFIGIGGIGMSGIAEILLSLGYPVSGSDVRRSAITDRLERLGATIFQGHAVTNVTGSGVVVTSSAIDERNVEVVEARARKIPVIPRAEMLAELMRIKYGIAVAGMHGKTTTTSMIATVLAAGGLDPTVVVGGRVDALGSNARWGKSQYLVAEADESDRSFLKLSPILSVVTNLDREHMDCYRDLEDVDAAFLEFMNRVPFYGACTACIDNTQLAALLPRVPGRHNVLNAAAAVAIGVQLEIEGEKIAAGLKSYRGVDRRFELKGSIRGVAVVDDYGHHPTEILATLSAARDCGFARVHVIFQPHRYSRTRDLMQEFATAFDGADTVQILDIYPASEEPIPGIDAAALIRASKRKELRYAEGFQEAAARAAAVAAEGDVILTLGAGSVSQVAGMVLQTLEK
jgi:UDP-N-acetylmuramate--alanine ligase